MANGSQWTARLGLREESFRMTAQGDRKVRITEAGRGRTRFQPTVTDGRVLEDPVTEKCFPAALPDLLDSQQHLEDVSQVRPVVLHSGRASARMRSASIG